MDEKKTIIEGLDRFVKNYNKSKNIIHTKKYLDQTTKWLNEIEVSIHKLGLLKISDAKEISELLKATKMH